MVESHPTERIRGEAEAIGALRSQIVRLATFDTAGRGHAPTVLLFGETGTGKGLVARVLHDSGGRAAGPFIDVNCAAIPESMLEAELFGFEAGAFTDAKRAKPGLFEAAARGTLFLDEVDALTPACQSKLLKVIEDKTVRRLGAVTPYQMDVKLIAATQRDLPALVAAGQFRADLHHRLAVVVLALPPLRERRSDVVALAEHFLRTYGGAHGVAAKRLTPAARDWLAAQPWPGNIRELSHLMERAILLTPDDEIAVEHLVELAVQMSPAAPHRDPSAASTTTAPATDDEAARIRDALRRAGGNVVGAARLLGLGRNALRYRMRRHGIDRPSLAELADAPEAPRAAPVARPRAGTAPSVEEKPVAVLALELVLPPVPEDATTFDPWTLATRWESMLDQRIRGFGGLVLGRGPTRRTIVYGIPHAVEQLPDRALQTAIALLRLVTERRDLGPAPELRAAIHCGTVRIDTTAADPTARLLPVGDTLALADRLLGHAGRDEILVSAAAARRVRQERPLQPRAIRIGGDGDERLDAFVLGRADRPPLTTKTDTPFIGRQRETDVLRDTYATAAGGAGQVAFVTGDAGIGKSRLLAELRRSLAATPHRWIEGHCAAYGATTPFLPLVDGLRHFIGIEDRDDEAAASAKIPRAVAEAGGGLDWIEPYLRQILSFAPGDERLEALDSASRRSETFAALKALVLRLAERQPLVLVIEDLHWIDPASEEFLAFLGDSIPTARALLVCSYRSGYQHRFGDRSYHVRVALQPLAAGETDAMTAAVLADAAVPADVRSLVAHKAEGNPFFVEEVVASLLEDGTLRRAGGRITIGRALDAATVPDRIHDVLAARLDRLGAEAKQAIQVASVIGREFVLRLLERIAEAGPQVRAQVEALRGLELIYEKHLHPELAYMFKHALTHEVAYESVPGERRKLLHRTIGTAIETLYADRVSEHYETLAHHFAAGEEWPKAYDYHGRAAVKAEASFMNRAVIAHCRAALAIAERLGESVPASERAALEQRLGLACFHVSEYETSARAYERASALQTHPEAQIVDLGWASLAHFWGHCYEDARRTRTQALAGARTHGALIGEAFAISLEGFARRVLDGAMTDAGSEMEHALALARRSGNEEIESLVLAYIGQWLEWEGRYPEAVHALEGALALGRKLRLAHLIVMPAWFQGKARCCLGDYERALGELTAAYDICDRIGDRAWKGRMLNTLGWCHAEIGDLEQARSYNEAAVLVAREIDDLEIIANAQINLAAVHLALDDPVRALDALAPIEARLSAPDPWMRWRFGLHARDVRARLDLRAGALTDALAHAEAELAGARRHSAAKVETRAGLTRGRVLMALERWDEADAGLAEALAVAERIGHPRAAWQVHVARAELGRRRGDRATADAHAARAAALNARMAGALGDAELQRRVRALEPDR